jgi:hypothetical protein
MMVLNLQHVVIESPRWQLFQTNQPQIIDENIHMHNIPVPNGSTTTNLLSTRLLEKRDHLGPSYI